MIGIRSESLIDIAGVSSCLSMRVNITRFCLLPFIASALCAQQDNAVCALKFQVRNTEGVDLRGVTVQLRDAFERVVHQTRTDDAGKGEFCDFPAGIHSLVVGAHDSMPTVLQNIRLDLQEPLRLVVVLNPGRHSQSNFVGCRVTIRFVAEDGTAIPGVSVLSKGRDFRATGDTYGRVQTGLTKQHGATLIASAPAFLSEEIPLFCWNTEMLNRVVTLKRAR